ncbi:MAG: TAXI family TRAP transporter solute-binding subunit [Rickettsiaceae bacterium]|nr:TAXI family TRAP transporter solute-binding subunit [Rickettsiaceae bacterium]
MIKINITLKGLFLLFLALVSCFTKAQDSNEDIIIATGRLGGAYHATGLKICHLIEKYSHRKCTALPTKASLDNIKLLQEGYVDFGFTQEDHLYTEISKQPDELDKKINIRPIEPVLHLYPEYLMILVKKDGSIQDFYDLCGVKIGANSIISTSSALLNIFEDKSFKVKPRLQKLTTKRIGMKLCEETFDAVAVFSGYPSVFFEDISKLCSINVLSIPNEFTKKIAKDNHVYKQSSLEFAGSKINTVHTDSVLAARSDIDREKISVIRKIIRKYFDEFKASHNLLRNLEKSDVFRD